MEHLHANLLVIYSERAELINAAKLCLKVKVLEKVIFDAHILFMIRSVAQVFAP